MAGFLEKNKRLIDYKLTEFGRDKLAKGSLGLKYYTFSDSSIKYEENLESTQSFKVSSLKNYLPFEVDVNVTNIINPEYTLSSVISFDDLDNDILFVNKSTNSTLSDHLINLRLLDNKNVLTNIDNRTIDFDFKDERDEFDFKNNAAVYPTVKFGNIDLRNVEYVCKDKRFIDKTRNKYLPPKNSFKEESAEEANPESFRPIEFLLKNLNIQESLPQFTTKELFISELLRKLDKSKEIFKLDYVLNEEKMSDDDVYLFELHKVFQSNNISVNQKLSFVDLGEFYDEKEYSFKKVYLVGKIFLTKNIKDEIDVENKRKRFSINNDYSFVNMFTMVVE